MTVALRWTHLACRRNLRPALLLAVLLGTSWVATPPAEARVIHRERSVYSTILVDQQGPVICMQFSIRQDQRNQSCFNERRPKEMLFPYAHMMMASLLVNPQPKRLLMLGLGGGTLPLALDELYPDLVQDVIELDPAVVRVAREYFGFAPSGRVTVIPQDGRVFVKRAAQRGERYDLIMLDAFNGEYIPEHLMTREFLEEVRELLTENGVLAANTFSISALYEHESATYAAVYAPFFNLKPSTSGNRVIIARKGPLPTRAELEAQAALLAPRVAPYRVAFDELLPLMTTETDWDAATRILTDQYAPANLLQNR